MKVLFTAFVFFAFAALAEAKPKKEDGGGATSEGRDQVKEFFGRLKKTRTIAEEKNVAQNFAKWLEAKGYEIEVETEKGGKHLLTCPYFPPDTPWIDYRFRSLENLEIIPHRFRSEAE